MNTLYHKSHHVSLWLLTLLLLGFGFSACEKKELPDFHMVR